MKAPFPRAGLFVLLLFCVLGSQAQWPASGASSHFVLPPGAEYVPGQILFKLSPACRDQSPWDIAGLGVRLREAGVTALKKPFRVEPIAAKREDLPDLDAIYQADLPPSRNLVQTINTLLESGALAYAEPRYVHRLLYLPNDLYADTTLPNNWMWHLGRIRAYEAWDISRGDTSVVIGISDSGISFDHQDLKKNLYRNHGDPIDGQDNDGDGYVDNYRGWDLSGADGSRGDNDPSIPCSSGPCVHGVPVAGIAAADTDNRLGVAGVGFNCRYLPLKASSDSFPDGITQGYESILYGAQQGAQIINCSWGSQVNSRVGADIVRFVHVLYGTGIIAACGNTPADLAFYPASYPEVISVSNLHYEDSICCPGFLSSTHNYAVDVAAPGWELYSTVGETSYGPFSGTSAASPVVAGAAGLVLAHFPNYSGFQAAQRVRVTTDNNMYQNVYNEPYFEKLGTGRVNVYRALTDPLKPSIRLTAYRFDPDPDREALNREDTLRLYPAFVNYLDPSSPALEISYEVSGDAADHVEIIRGNWQAGTVNENETVEPPAPFSLRLKRTAPENLILNLRFHYRDSALAYDDFEYLTIVAQPNFVDVKQNLLLTTVNALGNLGYANEARVAPGLGVQYNGNEQSALGEAGFMVSVGNEVADNVAGPNGARAAGWRTVETISRKDHPLADFYAEGRMEDRKNLGLQVRQEVFAWGDRDADDYILLRYTLINRSGTILTNTFAGIFTDWEIFNRNFNAANYNGVKEYVYTYDRLGGDRVHYGLGLLGGGGFRAYAAEKSSFAYDANAKIQALQSIASSTSARVGTGSNPVDVVQAISAGPLAVATGDSLEVVFVLFAGRNRDALPGIVDRAAERYRCYLGGFGPDQGFDSPSLPVLVGSPVTFQDRNPNATQWRWDFGDGTTGPSVPNPAHTYLLPGNYTVTGTAIAGLCQVRQKRLVQVRRTVGIAAAPERTVGLRAYPNPVSRQLRIHIEQAKAGSARIGLINLLGQQVWQEARRIPASGTLEAELQVESLAPGLYYLFFQQEGVRICQEVMINPQY